VLCLASVVASALVSMPALAQPAQISGGSLSPAEIYLPDDDDALARYADLVAGDFERYVSEISDYFACMDATRQLEFERAQQGKLLLSPS